MLPIPACFQRILINFSLTSPGQDALTNGRTVISRCPFWRGFFWVRCRWVNCCCCLLTVIHWFCNLSLPHFFPHRPLNLEMTLHRPTRNNSTPNHLAMRCASFLDYIEFFFWFASDLMQFLFPSIIIKITAETRSTPRLTVAWSNTRCAWAKQLEPRRTITRIPITGLL